MKPQWIYPLCAVSLTFFLCRWIESARDLTLAQKGVASAAVEREAEKTREWLKLNILPLASDTLQRADARSSEALGIVRDLGNKAEALLAQTERDANARLAEVTAAAAELAKIRQDAQPALQELATTLKAPRPAFVNANLILAEVHKAISPNMDPTNPRSWPSRVTGMMGSGNTLAGEMALTMRHWRKETPAIAAGVAGTAQNVKQMTARKRWYVTAASIAVTAGVTIWAAKK